MTTRTGSVTLAPMASFSSSGSPTAWLVAGIALALALASTAIAADPVAKLSKKKVAKIANKEIDKRAPGLTVGNADTVDSLDSTAFLRATGCGRGKVQGFARFDPSAMVAASSGYSTAGVSNAENCAGGSVDAHKVAPGEFRIRFQGLSSALAVCSVLADGDSYPTAATVAASVIAPGHFRINEILWAGGGAPSDTKFACIIV